jgi:hypothetical protein
MGGLPIAGVIYRWWGTAHLHRRGKFGGHSLLELQIQEESRVTSCINKFIKPIIYTMNMSINTSIFKYANKLVWLILISIALPTIFVALSYKTILLE